MKNVALAVALLIAPAAPSAGSEGRPKPSGSLIAPIDAEASSRTDDVTPGRLIDGSGLAEETPGGASSSTRRTSSPRGGRCGP